MPSRIQPQNSNNGHTDIVDMLKAAEKQMTHAGRVIEKGKDNGPPQVGG